MIVVIVIVVEMETELYRFVSLSIFREEALEVG